MLNKSLGQDFGMQEHCAPCWMSEVGIETLEMVWPYNGADPWPYYSTIYME